MEYPLKKFKNHLASSPTLSKVMNSNFIVYLAIYICLEDFHDTSAPPSVKTYILVDFEFLMSDIQLTPLYFSSIDR
jgi:hypothetical protein